MIKKIITLVFVIEFAISFFINNIFAEETLKLATTTSVAETDVLDYILPPFEKKHNIRVHVISVGTGKAIKLGENGDVDIIFVHAREAEDKFVNDGYGINRQDIMYNNFLVVGPENDPANIKGLKSAEKSLKRIYNSKHMFVSRGDNSGTYKKEKSLWLKTGLNPKDKKWYLESGQGMSATLRMADEKNAYVLVDSATYLFHKNKIALKVMVEEDKKLLNFYGVIQVNPHKYPHVKHKLSQAFVAWLISSKCQKMIQGYKKNGYKLYYPAVGKLID